MTDTGTTTTAPPQNSLKPRHSSSWTGKLVMLTFLIGLLGAIAFARPEWFRALTPKKDNANAHLVTQTARRGPFLISLSVQGHVDSRRNSTLSSQVEGMTTIISIVPEGTLVKEGDVVCELDSATLREQEKQQQITVTQAEAAEAQARENLEIQRTQNESDIAAAELAWELAKLDLEKYQKGELDQLLNQVRAKIELAREEYVQSQENHEFTKRLVKKGYKNQNDLEAARISEKQKELALAGAEEELKVLDLYTSKRTIAELVANSREFERELERVKLKAKAAESQFAKEYEAAQLTAEVEREKMARLQTQIEACTLRAPQPGEVVYANLESSRRGSSENVVIQEGAQVRERQAIINLPDITQMKVDCRIHESLIGNIRVGLPARVRMDAYADEIFKGKVASVSSVPMSGSFPNYDLREYETEVHLTEDVEKVRKLRPGLTAQLEILVDSRQDVLQIPMQAVVATGLKYFTFVVKPGESAVERRELKIGMSNESNIEILDGVAEGEAVVMNPRTHFAKEIAELETLYGTPVDDEAIEIPGQPEGVIPPIGGGPAAGPGRVGLGGGPVAGGPRGGDGGPGAVRGPGGGAGGGGRGGNPAAMLERMDGNGDGKLSADELPGGLASQLSEIDTDGDGAASVAELTTFFQKRAAAGGGGGPGGGGFGGGGPGGRPSTEGARAGGSGSPEN